MTGYFASRKVTFAAMAAILGHLGLFVVALNCPFTSQLPGIMERARSATSRQWRECFANARCE